MAEDRWITFDCYGTLIDWLKGFRKILSPIAGVRTDALLRAYEEAERTLEADRLHYLYRHVLTAGLARAAQKIGVDLSSKDAGLLVRSWGQLPLYSDVSEALDVLRIAGWKIGILTNCDDDLFASTLARHPTLRPDAVITAEAVGSYKPELGHFLRFESETRVLHDNWVHAANSWFHDIAPAKRYGIKRVWVDRDETGHDPAAACAVVDNVAALPKTLAALIRRSS